MNLFDEYFDNPDEEYDVPKAYRKLKRSKKLDLLHEDDITEDPDLWPVNSVNVKVPPANIKIITENQLVPKPSFLTSLNIMYFLKSTMNGLSVEKAENEYKKLRNLDFNINFRILLKTNEELHKVWVKYKEIYLDTQADSLLYLEDLDNIPQNTDKFGNTDIAPNHLKLREAKIRLKQYNLEKLHPKYKKESLDLQAGSQLGVVIIPQKGE